MGTIILMIMISCAATTYLLMQAKGTMEPPYPEWVSGFSLGEMPTDCQELADEIQRLDDLLLRTQREIDRAKTNILVHTSAASSFSVAAASLAAIGVLAVAGIITAELAVVCLIGAIICGTAAAAAVYNITRWNSYFNDLLEIRTHIERRLSRLYIDIRRCANVIDLDAMNIHVPSNIATPLS